MIILFLHLSFLLKNYKDIETKKFTKVFDYCIRQIELSIREVGYGDANINKNEGLRKFAIFYNRKD